MHEQYKLDERTMIAIIIIVMIMYAYVCYEMQFVPIIILSIVYKVNVK